MKKLELNKETLVSLDREEAHHVIGALGPVVTLPNTIWIVCNPTRLNCPSRACTLFPGCPPPTTSRLACPTII